MKMRVAAQRGLNGQTVMVTTREGYAKDQTPEERKRKYDSDFKIFFTGNNAPVKAVRAIMEKFGISKEEI